jgi:glycine cleavage system regulatory protein
MNDVWTLTLMGDDKANIIESLSDIIAKHKGNWLESRIAKMSHKFVAIIGLEIPQRKSSKLQDALESFSDGSELAMLISVNGQDEKSNIPTACVTITANDRSGIVLEITKVLSDCGLSVKELETHCGSAPFGNENLFTALVKVDLSEKQTILLKKSLEKLGDDFMVDIEFD